MVVTGLLTEVTVMGMLVPAATAMALMLTRTEVALGREQVELMLQEQAEVPLLRDISGGIVTMIFDPVVRALTVVKVTVRVDTMPIEELDKAAALTVMGEGEADTVTLPESIEKYVPPTKF